MITWSAHLSTLFADVPVVERPARAQAAGARVVESWWIDEPDRHAWRDAVRAHGLAVASINLDEGDLAAGDRGFLNVPAREQEVYRSAVDALALAGAVGARCVNVLVGRTIPDVARSRQLDRVRRILTELAPVAAGVGVTFVIEPQNPIDVPGFLLADARAAVDLVESIGHGSVRLLYDAYHAAAAGDDPRVELRSFAGTYAHVQYAAYPGRGPAGTGTSALEEIIQTLVDVGYAGSVGLEYFPKHVDDDPLDVVRRAWPQEVTPLHAGGER